MTSNVSLGNLANLCLNINVKKEEITQPTCDINNPRQGKINHVQDLLKGKKDDLLSEAITLQAEESSKMKIYVKLSMFEQMHGLNTNMYKHPAV